MRAGPLSSVCLSAIVILASSCKPTRTPKADDVSVAEVDRFVFKHKGIVRDVGLFDPRKEAEEVPRPMVIVLHGGLGEDDDTVALSFGKLNVLAAEDDFLVVYPAGVGGHWNDGRNVQRYVSYRERIDDVGFLSALIGNIVEKKQVDPDAIFVVGVSDGAMMAHRLACERTELLHAFAAVIGAMPRNVARKKSRCGTKPISVLIINGTEDPVVPWEGGMVTFDGLELGSVLSVERTFGFWTRHNDCQGIEELMIPDFSPTDGTRIHRDRAVGCRGNTKVELFEVRGAGHTWPSGWQYLPETLIGKTSHDIDAAVAAWRFFQSTL